MSVASASQSGVTANRPDEPAEPRKDRLITRDVALVMLATFFFMTSNMVITPVIAGYGESMGSDGRADGRDRRRDEFRVSVRRPIAGNLFGFGSARGCWWLRERCCTSWRASCIVLPIRRACWSWRAWSTGLASHAARFVWRRGCRCCFRSGIWARAWDCTASSTRWRLRSARHSASVCRRPSATSGRSSHR